MAKKGTTRPHRVDFEWDNGVSSCQTFSTAEEASAFMDEMERNAARQDSGIKLKRAVRVDGPRGSYITLETREVDAPDV